ncbi:MAG: hypothetical protein HC850_09625 [Rhodomicrobium sp.]|nr:hypothetical protein [Rhodomicrobium sp.]
MKQGLTLCRRVLSKVVRHSARKSCPKFLKGLGAALAGHGAKRPWRTPFGNQNSISDPAASRDRPARSAFQVGGGRPREVRGRENEVIDVTG